MEFGTAIRALKQGKRVARKGWNGKGMWLGLVKATNYIVYEHPYTVKGDAPEDECGLLPWIGMKTADGKFVPWLASQSDMLADDWMIVVDTSEEYKRV